MVGTVTRKALPTLAGGKGVNRDEGARTSPVGSDTTSGFPPSPAADSSATMGNLMRFSIP